MKYLCLIYDEEKKLQGMSKNEMDALLGEYFLPHDRRPEERTLFGGNDLQPVARATTVRVRNGKFSTASAQGRRL